MNRISFKYVIATNCCILMTLVVLYSSSKTKELKFGTEYSETTRKSQIFTNTLSKATTEYDWSSAAQRFGTRLNRLRRVCKSKILPSKLGYNLVDGRLQFTQTDGLRRIWKANMNFLVDYPRRLLVCAVPKSGSTSWHRTVWAIRRKRSKLSADQNLYKPEDTIRNQGIAMHLSQAEGNKLISPVSGDDNFKKIPPEGSSFRLILARHPFARFISGWNQKFMYSINYWVVLAKVYTKLLDYKKKIDLNRVMAFEDFAEFAARNPNSIRQKDQHFMPATVICKPCEYDYTYVVKAESIDIDDPWLRRRLGLKDIDVQRKGIPPGGSVVNNDLKGNIKKYMSMLSPDVVKGLYNIYKDDFDFFGYTFNFTTYEAGGFD